MAKKIITTSPYKITSYSFAVKKKIWQKRKIKNGKKNYYNK